MRKEQFKRPEPGFSLYEGRTRGKRMKYTYSDEEDEFLTDSTARRSTRNTRNHTPAEPAGPVITASGRQSRAPTRLTAEIAGNGEPSASGNIQGHEDVEMDQEDSVGPTGRPRRSAAVHHGMNGWASKKRKSEEYESDDEDVSEPDFGDDEDDHVPDESDVDEEEFEEDVEMDDDLDDTTKPSLVIKLPIKAAVDADGRAKMFPEGTAIAEKPRSSRPVHRNVVVSDESESTDGPEYKPVAAPEPEKSADVISVAFKGATQVPDAHPADACITAASGPLTPSRKPSTALAYRESPEKPQHVPRPIDVGGGE